MTAFLGLDVGTQGLKVVAIDESAQVLWNRTYGYASIYPQGGWVEQNPQDWVAAVERALQEAGTLDVKWSGVGITGQMHTLVVSDEHGNPLRNAILWSDQRTGPYVDWLTREVGLERLLQITGNAPLTNYTALRLLWLRDHEPTTYGKIASIAVAKDWLRGIMTETHASDVSDASGTYLLDVRRRQWHIEWIQRLGIDPAWVPPVAESHDIVGEMRVGPSSIQGVPVVAGAGDQAAGAVGMGLSKYELGLSLGTSGVLFWLLDQFMPPPDPSIHAFCHAETDTWHWMSVTQAAGLSVRWLRDVVYGAGDYGLIDHEASTVSPGAEGLMFLPYLSGERSPIRQPNARAVFYGLGAGHGRANMARAVLEGVAYSIRHCWDVMSGSHNLNPSCVVLTGGGSRSELWSQMMADVLELPVEVSDNPGAAVGAAWLARNAILGRRDAFPRRTLAVREPQRKASEGYQGYYARYRALVDVLTTLWADQGKRVE